MKNFSFNSPRNFFGKRGRDGNSFLLQPLSFPPRPSGLEFCETPQAFRSKKVRTFSIIVHQTGFCKFLETDKEVCSPCPQARLARNWAVKSNGGTKSQEAIFSEMRRFVPIFLTKHSACGGIEAIFQSIAEHYY